MQKIKMSRGVTLTFEEGCNKYLENCRHRNLREGTISPTAPARWGIFFPLPSFIFPKRLHSLQMCDIIFLTTCSKEGML